VKLRLIDRPTFEDVKIGDTSFKVRLMSYGDSVELRRRCTVAGRVLDEKLEDAEWEFILAGWEGLADAAGADVPYDAKQASFVGQSLSLDVASLLKRTATRYVTKAEEALGNSGTSSGNAPGETKTPSGKSTDGQA